MAWRIEYLRSAQKSVRRIDPAARKRIRGYLEQRIAPLEDPRQFGKPLKGELSGLWRCRVGDYRIVCEIRDAVMVVLVIHVASRKDVYRI